MAKKYFDPIVIDNKEVKIDSIKILEQAYPLAEKDFNKLISNSSVGCKDWAKRIFFISLGLAIKILGVLIIFFYTFIKTNDKNEVKLQLQSLDIVVLIIGILLFLILFIAGKVFKNDRDHLITRLRDFYNENNINISKTNRVKSNQNKK